MNWNRRVGLLVALILAVACAWNAGHDISSAVVSRRGGVTTIKITGRISTFGGPEDGRQAGNPWSDLDSEGLALWDRSDERRLYTRGLLALSRRPGLGLARRLDPHSHYVAARWPGWGGANHARLRRGLRESLAVVEANGRAVDVWPVDYGPAEWTGRAIDLSPGAAEVLGVVTGDVATLTVELK